MSGNEDDQPTNQWPGLQVEDLHVRALSCKESPAFPLTHDYFEIVWAPALGPTPVLLARAVARRLDGSGGAVVLSLPCLARAIGVRSASLEPMGAKSPLGRALRRLLHHGILVAMAEDSVGLRLAVPAVSQRVLGTLPHEARVAHERFVLDRVT